MSNPSRQHTKVLYRWRGQKKRKDWKTGKNRSEKKVVGYSSASLFLARKWETVTQGGTGGKDHLMWRKTYGASIIIGWGEK